MKASISTKPALPASRGGGEKAAVAANADPEVPGDLAALQTRSGEAVDLLKAIANADRLLLLCVLLDAERPVAELGVLTGIRQPTLSQQLAVLRTQRLVATRRAGKSIHYRIAAPQVQAILRTLHRLYCAPGSAQH